MATVYLKSLGEAGTKVFDTAVSSTKLAYDSAQSCESYSLRWISVPKMVIAYLVLMTILGVVFFLVTPYSTPLTVVHVLYSLLTAGLIALVCAYNSTIALVVMLVAVALAGVGMFAGYTATVAADLATRQLL